jgi:FKBP-type peptidyl-prolyl cis-trans isomerase FkpA
MDVGALFRRAVAVAALGLVPALLIGCEDTPTSPSNYAPYSQTDLHVGPGAEAAAGSVVTVSYTGWLYDGSRADHKGAVFDSSLGTAGLQFTVGTGQVIQGWDQGIVGMKVGGLRRLVIPPSLGYGPVRFGPIPPNATLIFEVELIEIQASS